MTNVYDTNGKVIGQVHEHATSIGASKLTSVPMQFGRVNGEYAWKPATGRQSEKV